MTTDAANTPTPGPDAWAPPAAAVGRIGAPGTERPVVLLDGQLHDAGSITDDIDGPFLADDGPQRAIDAARAGHLPPFGALDALDPVTQRLGAPIATPTKIVCIGLNYFLHARETGAEPPAEPVVFMKDPGCIVGPHDEVLIPRGSTKTDWEVELAVVIGRTARYLEDPATALGHVAGYSIANDVSEREFQLERGGQWDKGKSCETFNPLGPWLVPPGELGDPQALDLALWVDDRLRQSSTTADMIFPVAHLVWYLSQFMVLRPGDVINTGTPAGVALGLPDTPYLRPGQTMELAISGLGRQRQVVR